MPASVLLLRSTIGALVALIFLGAVGRALSLAGRRPFTAWYQALPTPVGGDAAALDAWFRSHPVLTWTHITAGSLVTTLVLLQLSPTIRTHWLPLPRWAGRLVLLASIPMVFSGVLLQTQSRHPGILAPAAIYFFASLFLIALWLAYRAIRRGDQLGHRRWMIRMAAIVLGVGAVRLVALPLILVTGQRPLALAGVAFWLGLGGASIAGELWLRASGEAPPAAT